MHQFETILRTARDPQEIIAGATLFAPAHQ